MEEKTFSVKITYNPQDNINTNTIYEILQDNLYVEDGNIEVSDIEKRVKILEKEVMIMGGAFTSLTKDIHFLVGSIERIEGNIDIIQEVLSKYDI